LQRGWFITFEGGEGTGKSTQLELLGSHLTRLGMDTVLTREPGGTALAEAIRAVVTDPEHEPDGLSEMLLMEAARHDHVERVIRPGLDRGAVVLSDRFADSTTVYQGMVRDIGIDVAERLNALATGDLAPDLTVLLDMDPKTALARALERNLGSANSCRFDNESETFHRLVRDGFLRVARMHPGRVRVTDAGGEPDEVHRRIVAILPEELQ